MPRVDGFAFTSEFDTLKNDGVGETSVTIPGGTAFAAGETKTFTTTVPVGTPQSLILAQFKASTQSNWFDFSVSFSVTRTGSGGPYDIQFRYEHIGSNIIKAYCTIKNPYGVAMTSQAGDETFNFRFRTFALPRFS